MGVLASADGSPVGWCACGPRFRYLAAGVSRAAIWGSRPRAEDDTVWLLPCLYVRPGHRGQGVSHALVHRAVALARRDGAVAIEAWPVSESETRSSQAFLGREQLFETLGFRCVERPSPGRVIMRLELQPG